jgi:hypothetical protein
MTRIIGGIVQHIDRERGEVVLGGERLPILLGMPVDAAIAPGTSVTALVRERDGRRDVVTMSPTAPRFYPKFG